MDQFLILDDSSSDGTREFLSAQTDCLVLSSDLGFGDPVAASGEDGARTTRAGTLLKKIIPQKYLKNKYAVYADADEFLILPEGIDDIRTAIRILERDRIACVAASLIDFYPQGLVDLDRCSAPDHFQSFSSAILIMMQRRWSSSLRTIGRNRLEKVPRSACFVSMASRMFHPLFPICRRPLRAFCRFRRHDPHGSRHR